MIYKTQDIKVSVKDFHEKQHIDIVSAFLKMKADKIKNLSVYKKSVDARKKNNVFYVVSFVFETNYNLSGNKNVRAVPVRRDFYDGVKKMSSDKSIVIVGSGSAGLFCALYLAKAGLKPLLIEQGKPVAQRQNDIDRLWLDGILDEQSNVQFGLGGAGTFSDGKLTSSAHNEYVYSIFSRMVKYGAPNEILYEAMPHVGTDNLKIVVSNIADEIQRYGGRILFDTKMTDLSLSDKAVSEITVARGGNTEKIKTDILVLAIGHSARDTFEKLLAVGMNIEQKPFSVGVRVEHKREMINKARYGENYDRRLPAATYKMAAHLENGRSVYTFCMCPGGKVVLSSSEKDTVVVNGMSFFARDDENSNSALLVNVDQRDFGSSHPLAGVEFQRRIEKAAFDLTGGYNAPCQNVADFIESRASEKIDGVKPSISPSARPCDLSKCLPQFVCDSLKEGLKKFGKTIDGFDKCGVLTAPETRSSSPVRLVRDEDYMSNIVNVFPCGEGSGYAGGIITAAVDGLKCALKIVDML